MTIVVRALGWDHPRCMIPMRASAAAWRKLHPDVSVEWTARPLEQFNDQPLTELIGLYDILVVDHPYVGTAEKQGLLKPLDGLLDAGLLARLAADSAGQATSPISAAGTNGAWQPTPPATSAPRGRTFCPSGRVPGGRSPRSRRPSPAASRGRCIRPTASARSSRCTFPPARGWQKIRRGSTSIRRAGRSRISPPSCRTCTRRRWL